MDLDEDYTPLCEQCGYNLTGLVGDICPECGRGFVRSELQQSRIAWSRRAAIGKGKAYWLTLAQVLVKPGMMARRAGGDVERAVADAEAFRKAVTWTVSVATGILVCIAACMELKEFGRLPFLLAIAAPLTAIATAMCLTAGFECIRTYRVSFPAKPLRYMSEALLCYGMAPMTFAPFAGMIGYILAISRRSHDRPWIYLVAAAPVIASWVSVVRLGYAITGGAAKTMVRLIVVVPIVWGVICVIWGVIVSFIFAAGANLL